ncbi:nitrogenase component 1 family protein [Roseixanthobacter liquoris]|uniref:hypothetical protein n=1 Tax=Roseixanthobacter liquoris TaxID=3119921 RepID=UPI00372BEA5B
MSFEYVILHCAAETDEGYYEYFPSVNVHETEDKGVGGPTNRALWRKYSIKKKILTTSLKENNLTLFVNFSHFVDSNKKEFLDRDSMDYIIESCASARKIIIMVHGKAGDSENCWTYANSNSKDMSANGITEPLSKFLSYDNLAKWVGSALVGKKQHLLSLVMCYGARSASGMKEDHDKLADPSLIKDSFAFKFFDRLCRAEKESSYIMTARTSVVGMTTAFKSPNVGMVKTLPETETLIRLQLEEEERELEKEMKLIQDENREKEHFSKVENFAKSYGFNHSKGNQEKITDKEIGEISEISEIKKDVVAKIFRKEEVSQAVAKKIDTSQLGRKVGKFVYLHFGDAKIKVYRKYKDGKLIKEKKNQLDAYLDGKNLDEIGELIAEYDIV